MKTTTTRRFRTLLSALPPSIQEQAKRAYQLFLEDPSHPSLAFKPVSTRDPTIYSVRIGIHYRAIGIREANEIASVWIGTHSDYDNRLKRL